ncbi:hypothetical protein HS125_15540 [bacterium]|nr:hypothetical protein [bacterium]
MLRLIQPIRYDIRQKRATLKPEPAVKTPGVLPRKPRVWTCWTLPDLQTLAKMVTNLATRLRRSSACWAPRCDPPR